MRRPAVLLALVAGAILLSASPAAAHPLGNFTVNRYAGLTLMPKDVRVLYVVDMAEIPTFQELPTIDANGDGTQSPSELQAWADAQAASSVIPGLELDVGGTSVRLDVVDATASFRPGQGGLRCLRLETTLSGPADAKRGTMTFSDTNELDRIGWREITAVGQNGVALHGSSVPTASVSDTLLSYPVDLLSSPLSVRSMSTHFAPGVSTGAGSPADPSSAVQQSGRPLVESGAFAALVASRGLPLMALGMLLAISFGAWHALLPGHGKTLVAAAVVGSSARVRQTIVASIAVAVMHTASVIGLGLLILMLEQTFRPETLYPWLGMASGLAAVGIGIHLVLARVRSLRTRDQQRDHSHDHDHGHDHEHEHEHGHEHDHDARPGGFLSRRGIAALAFAGGILPAPSALVVMLASVQLRRTAYGLTLIAAFSVGLAVTLMVVGLSAARAGAALNRRSSVLARVLPVPSASAIVAVGGFLTIRGVLQV